MHHVQARCADVAVEEKEAVVVVAVEVERAAAGVARGTMTGQSKRLILSYVEDSFLIRCCGSCNVD